MPRKVIQVKKIKRGGISPKSVYVLSENIEFFNFFFDDPKEAEKFEKKCGIKPGDIIEIDYEFDKTRQLNIVKDWRKVEKPEKSKSGDSKNAQQTKDSQLKPWGTLKSEVIVKPNTPLFRIGDYLMAPIGKVKEE